MLAVSEPVQREASVWGAVRVTASWRWLRVGGSMSDESRVENPIREDGALSSSLSANGTPFATGGQEPSAEPWSADGETLRELSGGGGAQWVEHVAWARARGRVAMTAGKRARSWAAEGDPIVESEQLPSAATAVAWRSDGGALAAGFDGGVQT